MLLSGDAVGGTVVIHGGDEELALEAARARLRLPVGDFVPVATQDWIAPALQVHGVEVSRCERAPRTLEEVGTQVSLAERGLDFAEFEAARAALDEAWHGVRCLSEPLDALVAHRILFLYGVVEISQEAPPERVRAAFARARAFAPQVPWDDAFFPRGRELYETAVVSSDAPEFQLTLAGRDGEVVAWVDGKPWEVPLTLDRGEHLVQVGRSADALSPLLIHLDADAVAVVPDLDPEALTGWVTSDVPQLGQLVGAALPGEDSVYVADEAGVYRLSVVDRAAERLVDPPRIRRPWGPWAVAGGSACGLVGSVLAVPAFAEAERTAAAAGAYVTSAQDGGGSAVELRAAYDSAATAHHEATGRLRLGAALGAVGVGLVAAGALDWDAARRIRLRSQVRLGRGGAGVELAVIR